MLKGERVDRPAAAVGVVVVHYHRFQDLMRLLERIRSEEFCAMSDVVVCDNGSDPGDMDQLAEVVPGVRVLRFANIGYGAAANRGVRHFGPSYSKVLIATHELTFDRGCLLELTQTLDANPEIGVVGPLLRDESNNSDVWSVGGALSRFRRIPSHKVDYRPGEVLACEWLDGSALLFRRACFDAVGGFSESFFLYFEDVEICCAVKRLGYEVSCATAAVAYQSPGGHMNHTLAVRNLGWLMRSQGWWLAYVLWILENLIRAAVGNLMNPSGKRGRQRQRFSAVVSSLRLPRALSARKQPRIQTLAKEPFRG